MTNLETSVQEWTNSYSLDSRDKALSTACVLYSYEMERVMQVVVLAIELRYDSAVSLSVGRPM